MCLSLRRPACLLACLWLGCASTTYIPAAQPSSPFTATDRVLFDDGVDFVEDPSALSGRWRARIEQALSARIARSDVVGLVEIDAVGGETDPEGDKTFVLSTVVRDMWKSRAPEPLVLSSSPSQAGYSTIDRAQTGILKGRFALFLKWYRRESGQVAGHFHLSPASEAVIRTIKIQLSTNRLTVLQADP